MINSLWPSQNTSLSITQRWQAKLRELKEELRRRMHAPIKEQGAYLRSVLLGHFRYYGVPMTM
jgi:RNA-directed DNA polymerase